MLNKSVDLILQNYNRRSNALHFYKDVEDDLSAFLEDNGEFPNIPRIIDHINRNEDPHSNAVVKRLNVSLPITIKELSILECDNLTQFPQSICDLDLTLLKINDTMLTGILPDCLCNMTRLTTLHLPNNKIRALPDCIGSLTRIRTLKLSNNQLSVLPDSIGELSSLTTLDLDENRLTRLPDSIGQLSALVNLDVGMNELVGLPDSICVLPRLNFLELGGNRITRLPENFGQLVNLNFLGLASNRLREIPNSMEGLLLTYLNLDDNAELRAIPQTIGYFTNITVYIYGTAFYRDFDNNPLPYWPNVNFVPSLNVPEVPQQPEQPQVDALEVHRVAADIRAEDLVQFLKEKTGKEAAITPGTFSTYINNSIVEIINNCYPEPPPPPAQSRGTRKRRREQSGGKQSRYKRARIGGTRRRRRTTTPTEYNNEEKAELLRGLNDIMTMRLNGIKYSELSPLTLESIFYTLEYVKMQPVEFQKPYIHAFVRDCITAYEGTGEEAMTCAAGAMERVVLSLEIACKINESPDNQQIISYLSKAAMNPNDVVLQWYKDNHRCANFPKQSWDDEEFKKNNLRQYLLNNIEGSNPADFNQLIEDTQRDIGMDCPDDFAYGDGGRKKSRRRTRRLAK